MKNFWTTQKDELGNAAQEVDKYVTKMSWWDIGTRKAGAVLFTFSLSFYGAVRVWFKFPEYPPPSRCTLTLGMAIFAVSLTDALFGWQAEFGDRAQRAALAATDLRILEREATIYVAACEVINGKFDDDKKKFLNRRAEIEKKLADPDLEPTALFPRK